MHAWCISQTKVSVHILYIMIYVYIIYCITAALHLWSKIKWGLLEPLTGRLRNLNWCVCSFNGETVTRFETVLEERSGNAFYQTLSTSHYMTDSYEATTFATRCKSTTTVMYTITFSGQGVIQFVSNDMLQHVCGFDWMFYSDLHFPEFRDNKGNILYRIAQPWFPHNLQVQYQ